MLNYLGCELMAVIHSQFNPVIPLEKRVQTTKQAIEVFDEIFFSVGEQEKGFSLSLSQNYTNIGRINEIRTETFGSLGLLENEYPNEVIFPFETTHVTRFFDFTRILNKAFELGRKGSAEKREWFTELNDVELSHKEKEVFLALVKYPTATTQQIGERVGVSRHTVGRIKNRFFEEGLLRRLVMPDLDKLGFEILAFYHIKFNPDNPPREEDIAKLDSASTIFLARRKFEIVILSAYLTYQDYKEDKMDKILFLKEHDIISYTPPVKKYVFDRMTIIKDFDFVPITKKTLQPSD